MQIVFLNRFERFAAQGEERAQVFIGEDQGVWSAGWRILYPELEAQEDMWYEGVSWEELLSSFRFGISVKMRDGFRPLLDGMLEDEPFWERQPGLPLLLQCYADMQEEDEMTNKLRTWRRAKALEEKKPAYLVATNRELQLLAVFAPQSADELLQIPGFGKLKLEKYGADLLEILRGVDRKITYPLDAWVTQAVTESQFSAWMFRLKEEKYSRALNLAKEKKTLLLGIREGRSLEQLESELNCPRRMLMEKIERLDEEGYDVRPIIDSELAGLPGEECMLIESALNELGDRYLKPLRSRVYGDAKTNDKEAERQYEKLRMMRIRHRRASKSAM